MTTELERDFFETFGIKTRCQYKVHQFCHFYVCDKETILKNAYLFKERKTCKIKEVKKVYPDITAEKLLEIICINSQKGGIEIFNRKNIEELKNSMLQHCIDRLGYALNKEQYKQKIQQLFKEA